MAGPARMRTINGLYNQIHTMDPESQVSKHFLRQLIITGKVKSVKSGSKYLADLDHVLEYLTNPPDEYEIEKSEASFGKLRKIGG